MKIPGRLATSLPETERWGVAMAHLHIAFSNFAAAFDHPKVLLGPSRSK